MFIQIQVCNARKTIGHNCSSSVIGIRLAGMGVCAQNQKSILHGFYFWEKELEYNLVKNCGETSSKN